MEFFRKYGVLLFFFVLILGSLVVIDHKLKSFRYETLVKLNRESTISMETRSNQTQAELHHRRRQMVRERENAKNALEKTRALFLSQNGYVLVSPLDNEVIQRNSAGPTEVPINGRSVNPVSFSIQEKEGNATLVKGKFASRTSVTIDKPGFYEICLHGKRGRNCHPFSVGDLYLVAGQSNAESARKESDPPGVSHQKVSVSSNPQLPEEGFLIPTESSETNWSNVWLLVGDCLSERFGVPIGFVNMAKGSTSSLEWTPHTEFLSEFLIQAMKRRDHKALLWVQGESDSAAQFTEFDIFGNLRFLIFYSREIRPEMPWYIARNSSREYAKDSGNPVVSAQNKLIKEKLALAGPENDSIRLRQEWVDEGGAEFIGEGIREHARRWVQVLAPGAVCPSAL